MPPRKKVSIRDPLWGYVDLTDQEAEIVDSPAFQRLRGVKQLSFADYVYPSATHTRFAHSIGTLHVAEQVSRRIGLDDHSIAIVRLASLLHDIGHGPFSHLFEEIHRAASGRHEPIDHEAVTRALVQLDPDLRRILADDQEAVQLVLAGGGGILSEIVSGGLDADRFDYLLRDSHHAGVVYGQYDFARIGHTVIQHQGHVAIQGKGADAVEGLRLAREQMSFQVYYHHTKLVAERMLIRGVELAVGDGCLDRAEFDLDLSNIEAWGRSQWLKEDHHLIAALRACAKERSKQVLDDLYYRRLLKRAFVAEPDAIPAFARGEVQSDDFDPHAMEAEIAERADVPDHQVIVVKPVVSTKQYRSVAAREPIMILPEGKTELVEYEKFARIQGPSSDPWRLIVYAPFGRKDEVRRETESYLRRLG